MKSIPNQMAPYTLSLMEQQALEKLNVPADMLGDDLSNYASARAESRAWEEAHGVDDGSFLGVGAVQWA